MMDVDLKTKWLAALRSGKYKQGQRALKRNDEFCCLGVLCDVLGADWEVGADKDLGATVGGELQDYYLNPCALATAGFSEQQQAILYGMNDDQGRSFAEIADHIEANL